MLKITLCGLIMVLMVAGLAYADNDEVLVDTKKDNTEATKQIDKDIKESTRQKVSHDKKTKKVKLKKPSENK
ncbi:MAG: hypothetical protein SGI74_03950 [Oligoflexia bacterium]|nr:hypothetical protein [Oligoflexia bacterium]